MGGAMGTLKKPEATALSGLATLLWRGVSSDDLEMVATQPAIAEALETLGSSDEWALEHTRVMVRGAMPYASVFLSDNALQGGSIGATARVAFEGRGLDAPDPPDQIGALLGLYARLCTRDRLAAESLWNGHLRPFVAAALYSIELERSLLYGAIVEGVRELLGRNISGFVDGETANPLDDPETGTSELLDWWLAPNNAGWFLSTARIGAMPGATGFDVGFGDRREMFRTWVLEAQANGSLGTVLDCLDEEAGRWQAHYETQKVRHWTERITVNRAVLARVGSNGLPG